MPSRTHAQPPRHRIEHCQVTSPADLEALKVAGVGVPRSFFVNHVYFWGTGTAEPFLGEERSDFLDPLASRGRGWPAIRAALRLPHHAL